MLGGGRLWLRLLLLWNATAVLALSLLALDGWFVRPWKFYWLIPIPAGVGGWLKLFWDALLARPLTVSAVVLVPALALVGTVWLLAARAAWRFVRAV